MVSRLRSNFTLPAQIVPAVISRFPAYSFYATSSSHPCPGCSWAQSASMDRIEPFDNSDNPPDPQQGSEMQSLRPMSSASRPRTLSNSRRPSIRIQRRPSASSAESFGLQAERLTGNESRTSGSPSNALDIHEHHEWQGNRRRSSSEPRPGRWSAPNPDLLSRTATQDCRAPMVPLKEEPSSQTPGATTPPQGTDPHLLVPPPAVPRGADSRNMWRRTSDAALNRFSRNRASTVSGPPAAPEPCSEYDSRLVDILDTIGTAVA